MEQSKYQLLAPITSPDKVACIGMNYKDHCEEQGAPIPLEPLVFCKFPSCIIGPFDDIPYPTDISTVYIMREDATIDISRVLTYLLLYYVQIGAGLGSGTCCRHWEKREKH